jgi:hypothetical protein
VTLARTFSATIDAPEKPSFESNYDRPQVGQASALGDADFGRIPVLTGIEITDVEALLQATQTNSAATEG